MIKTTGSSRGRDMGRNLGAGIRFFVGKGGWLRLTRQAKQVKRKRVPSHSQSRHTYASCHPTAAMSLPVININVNYDDEKGL